MRLTLRTLLAYLDDLLEPQQARDLGERISRSEDASAMVARLKHVLRKRRIEAPPVDESGSQPSANMTAAYLDNTLTAPEVDVFERAALSDDVVLAETAGCHQILSVVLAEPVEVESDLRMRMYGFAGMDASPPTEEPSVPIVGARRTVTTAKPDEAEPRRASTKPWWIAAALGLMLIWGALYLSHFGDPAGVDREEVAATQRPLDVLPGDDLSGEDLAGLMAQEEPLVIDEQPPAAEPIDAGDVTSDAEMSPVDEEVSPGDEEQTPVEVPDDAMPVEAAVPVEVAATEASETPETAELAMTPADAPPAVASIFKSPDDAPAMQPAEATPAAEESASTAPAETDPEKAIVRADIEPVDQAMQPFVYQFAAGNEIVLHLERTPDNLANDENSDGTWTTLPPRSLLFPGEQVVVLPLNVGVVSIDRGMATATIAGPGRFRVRPATTTTQGGLTLDRGRMALAWSDSNERPVMVEVAASDRSRLLTLQPGGGVLTVEQIEENPVLAVVRGTVTVDEDTELAGEQIVSLATLKPVEAAGFANWVNAVGPNGSPLDRRYRKLFAETYDPASPARQQLTAMIADPQFRVSEIAAQTLGLMDAATPLVEALDSEFAETRTVANRELKRMLASGMIQPIGVRQTLAERMSDTDADAALTLLRARTKDDLRDPAVSQELLGFLRSENVVLRQLAIDQIRTLGGRDFGFQADASPSQRTASISRAEDWLRRRKAFVTPALEPAEDE